MDITVTKFTKDDMRVTCVGYAAPKREFVVCVVEKLRINLNFEYKSILLHFRPVICGYRKGSQW
jgi:hypothetical protein